MHGYSKTPLARKLGIKEGNHLLLIHAPNHYFDLFEDLPRNIEIAGPAAINESISFIHLFCHSVSILEKEVLPLIPLLVKTGMLWISWPKGSSSIKTDLNREGVRDYLLQHTKLVDIKVAAIDADWSGLKFVYRKEHR